ncbi:MAG: metallophosphoesterase [Clostridia bacterium]|nr:metallophosphoesterase [Clostridia bacterium]
MNETTLRFRNGKFRVLCVSDVHGIKDFDKRAVRDLTAIVDKAEPDLVLFLGDNVWHDGAESEETLRYFMSALIAPLHERSIPWAHVFGNHDAEKGFTVKDQQPIYESLPGCLSSAGPEDISGTGNWVLQVKQEHGEKTVFNIWGLDSGRGIGEFLSDYGFERDARLAKLEDPLYVSSGYDVIRFDQIMWYWNESKRIEAENGYKVPGMMVFHIAVPEYVLPYRNPAQTKYKGTMRETVGSGPINTGLFATLVQRGDVKTLVCGHDHINDTEGEYLGIKLTYDAGLGYDGYCAGDLRGGRIVEIDENDPWHAKTYMIRSSECVDGYEFESTLM